MTVQIKPLSEITRHAIDLFSKEMGIVDTVRFLNQFMIGYGDYTEEREALFTDLTLDDILATMKKEPSSSERLTEHATASPPRWDFAKPERALCGGSR